VKSYKKQIIIRAEQAEHKQLVEAALKERRSLSQFLLLAGLERAKKDDLLDRQNAS